MAHFDLGAGPVAGESMEYAFCSLAGLWQSVGSALHSQTKPLPVSDFEPDTGK